jgi:hypothetical protein
MAEQSKSPIAKLREKLLKGQMTNDEFIEALQALGSPTSTQSPSPKPAPTPRPGLPDAPAATPKGRGVGFVQGKDERDDEFAARKAQGLPSGARKPGTGMTESYYLQDRSNTPEEAKLRAALLDSQGGTLAPDESGNITIQKKGYRAAPQSSTGRNYDPVAERKSMMANAAAAVEEHKNLQASDQKLAEMQEAKMRTPGRMSGLAGPSGFGQAKELTAQELLDRKPATTPLSRTTGEMMPLRDELLFLNKDQVASGMPDSGYQERLDSAEKKRKKLLSAQQPSKQSAKAIPAASAKYGPGSGFVDPSTGQQMIM